MKMSEFDDDFVLMQPMGESRSLRPNRNRCWKNCLEKSDNCDRLRKHSVRATDTLQGIALKYRTTTDKLRRINKLLHSDSLHLRDVLYVPVNSNEFGDDDVANDDCDSNVDTIDAPLAIPINSNGRNYDDVDDDDNDGFRFLQKIESSIQQTKAKVDNYQKSRFNSGEPNNNGNSQIFRSNSTASSSSSSGSMTQRNDRISTPVQKSFFSRFQNPFGTVRHTTDSRTTRANNGNVTKTLFYSNNNLYQL